MNMKPLHMIVHMTVYKRQKGYRYQKAYSTWEAVSEQELWALINYQRHINNKRGYEFENKIFSICLN